MMRSFFVFVFLFFTATAGAQKLKKEDKQLLTSLEQHVQFLASDALQGRRTGTAGEQLAMEYLSNRFKAFGLAPKGTAGFSQPFTINEGKQLNKATHFIVNGQELQVGKEFFPLVYSPNINMEVLPSMALQEPDMPWFWNLEETLEQQAQNPHFDVNAAIRKKVADVQKKGATGLFVYNTSGHKDGLTFDSKNRSELVGIPVIYISKNAVEKYFSDEGATFDLKIGIDIGEKTRTGYNLIGYIDNGAPHTVILGAHYDHLGRGEDGNSLVRTGTTDIYNGADDNASGTAALLELARLLNASKLKASNYLFIAFSGEELGLFGSKYFTENPTIDLSSVSYMINMDMLGRLDATSNTITIGGYGTSPLWGSTYSLTGKKALYAGPLKYKFDSSGTGPSDHASFYRKSIPVLFYFTGLHADYHKPSDDFDKINYTGQLHIIKHIYSLLEATDKQAQKPVFTKTREAQTTTNTRFTVTLGIMPDYTYSGNGVRVDGISEGRPAQKAGLQKGDVVTMIGNVTIHSMEAYMQALSSFKSGDKTTVQYQRDGKIQTASVMF